MLKKSIVTMTLLLFTLVSISVAFADSSGGPDGNKRKGKYSYRKLCKACFKAGDTDTASPKVSPADYTMAEWKDIFENQKFEVFGCESHWSELSEQAVLDIYSYFYHHAKDSPTPAKCG